MDEIFYTEDLSLLLNPGYKKGWCAHMICTCGEAKLVHNGTTLRLKAHDLFVSPRLDLLERIEPVTDNCRVQIIMANLPYLATLLPANNFGIGGSIHLFSTPVLSIGLDSAELMSADFQAIRIRLSMTDHMFQKETVASLCSVMMNDIFDLHSRYGQQADETMYPATLVARLIGLLTPENIRQSRSVTFYAHLLNVTPKYLTNTVRRVSGRSVTNLINRHAVPMLKDYLLKSRLSLREIADIMHFCSVSYLCRYTEKHLGESPTSLRRNTQIKLSTKE